MKNIKHLLIIIVSGVVLNVWLFRFDKATIYRGGEASNMIEEFQAYGLSESMVYIIGALKVILALSLLAGLFFKKTIVPASALMALLMVAAIIMHFKVADEAIKYLPAGLMLVSCSAIILLERRIQTN